MDAAFAAIDAVHQAMSFHEPGSELSAVNRGAAGAPQAVGRLTWRVLRAALALARASDGGFDPTVAARLVDSGHLPAPDGPRPDPRADWRDVELLSGRRVRFRRPLWLDLGGIAKGHAVDRAVRAMQYAGAAGGVVNAGGDLRVFGLGAETVHVRHPANPARGVPLLQLRNGAVATSAGYFSERGSLSALVDPHDGGRLGAATSATVCAPRAIWADALTKVVLVDPGRAAPLLRRLHARAALLDAAGTLRTLP